MFASLSLALGALVSLTTAQGLSTAHLIQDPGVYGPALELVHQYYDEWPTGIAVSSTGRKFSNYPPGLDVNNTNTGSNGKYTVAELIGNSSERAFPSVQWNNPPGGAINYTTSPPSGANYQNYLIGVQSVVIDAMDRLWILDTGRSLDPRNNNTLVPATTGGPKLVGVDLRNNDTVIQTIIFPVNVAYPDSYLNDVRFDLSSNITSSGKGVAYITDSSLEGRNGIIIVDLGTGESWRHLDNVASVRPETGFLAYVWGVALYSQDNSTNRLTSIGFGSDGIAISADGSMLYWGAVASRFLYSAPTSLLRSRAPNSELLLQGMVQNHGQKGVSDGFETDTNGYIYVGNMEQNGINLYNPANGTNTMFVRSPYLSWVDTMSVATDGYLYFTDNQLCFSGAFYPGKDRRVRPFSLWRAKLPNGGTKLSS